jgi:hypothetical protein
MSLTASLTCVCRILAQYLARHWRTELPMIMAAPSLLGPGSSGRSMRSVTNTARYLLGATTLYGAPKRACTSLYLRAQSGTDASAGAMRHASYRDLTHHRVNASKGAPESLRNSVSGSAQAGCRVRKSCVICTWRALGGTRCTRLSQAHADPAARPTDDGALTWGLACACQTLSSVVSLAL